MVEFALKGGEVHADHDLVLPHMDEQRHLEHGRDVVLISNSGACNCVRGHCRVVFLHRPKVSRSEELRQGTRT